MSFSSVARVRGGAGAMVLAMACFASPASADETTTRAPSASEGQASSATTATTSAPEASGASAEGKRTVWPWILMGTGAALVATAGVLQLVAVSEDDKREAAEIKLSAYPQGDPARNRLQDTADSHGRTASSTRTAQLVVGTVGFLTVAGAVILWFVEGSGSSAPAARPAASARWRPSVTPSLGVGYAGGSVVGSF